jgi:hypothetical protein
MKHMDRRGMAAFLATQAALAWSAGFVVWALIGSAATSCTGTAAGEICTTEPLITRVWPEVLTASIPIGVCLLVWLLLHRYCSRGNRAAYAAAILLVTLFAIVCFLALLSIGSLLAPIALLLGAAVAATEPPVNPPAALRA